ncbi:MAG: hypothetical protein AAF492_13900, partial [Verrucomicrobiota bacterium]
MSIVRRSGPASIIIFKAGLFMQTDFEGMEAFDERVRGDYHEFYPGDDIISAIGRGEKADSTTREKDGRTRGSERTSGKVIFVPMDCDRIAAGMEHSLYITSRGRMASWGNNVSGALGHGHFGGLARSAQAVYGVEGVGMMSNVCSVSGGESHTLALTHDGRVCAWGSHRDGQLGIGVTCNDENGSGRGRGRSGRRGSDRVDCRFKDDQALPMHVLSPDGRSGLSNIAAVVCGLTHSMALDRDGVVYAWGDNRRGQLGIGSRVDRPLPVAVRGPENDDWPQSIVAIGAGNAFSLALDDRGRVWSWGDNYYGQLGDGTKRRRRFPVLVSGGAFSMGVAISAGRSHALALKADGTVWSWGDNRRGQLGDGTRQKRKRPVPVIGPEGAGVLSRIVLIAAGGDHNLALDEEGRLWSWGSNASGALGNSEVGDDCPFPVPVRDILDHRGRDGHIVAIAAGGRHSHSMALTDDDILYTWGANDGGQLGQGDTESTESPAIMDGEDGIGDALPDSWELNFFDELGLGPDDDPDGDGIDNKTEFRDRTEPDNADSLRVTVSGDIANLSRQTGPIYLVAVTSPTNWSQQFSALISTQTVFSIVGIPAGDTYWFKAFVDSNGNRDWDPCEAQGIYSGDGTLLTNHLTDVGVTLDD